MASSEEVVLVTGQVRHAKKDGTLYLMAWQEENKDIFSVNHHYADSKRTGGIARAGGLGVMHLQRKSCW